MISRCMLLAMAGMGMGIRLMAQEAIPADLFTIQESLLESVASADGESADFDALLNELEKLQHNPVDLNRANREELHKLFFLTDFQITSLIDYRQANGLFLSVNELQLVHGFTDELIALMLPFIVIQEQEIPRVSNVWHVNGQANQEFTLRMQRVLEEARGYH
jgi:DNA uptake protein ComE-like DNA-binding protein